MALDDEFFVTAGSVVGRDHVRLHKNNQDGVALAVHPDVIVAVVTDGCSSGKHSEVGARLAAAWLAQWVPGQVRLPQTDLPVTVSMQLTSWLRGMVIGFLPSSPEESTRITAQFFLFTYLVAVIQPERTLVFGEGDGVVSVNGRTQVLDSGPDNAPRYPAYACVRAEDLEKPGGRHSPVVLYDGPTCELASLAIGTDGVADLIARSEEPLSDGQPQGGLDQFETDARYLKNPSLVHKRLIVLGDVHGRLRDDTTLALIRRKAAE